MTDTGFCVPADKVVRLSAFYREGPNGHFTLLETPAASDWLRADRAPSGCAGLLSTEGDTLRFAQMLLSGGEFDGVRIISRKSVELTTANHMPATMLSLREGAATVPGDGYGLGLFVRVGNEAGTFGSIGMYGWPTAVGAWYGVDPIEDLNFVHMAWLFFGSEPIAVVNQNLVYQALLD